MPKHSISGNTKALKRAQRLRDEKKRKIIYRQKVLKTILKFDAPELKMVCSELKKGDDLSFINDMKLALSFTDYGVGLAASQIGVIKKAFVTRFDYRKNNFQVFINPEILETSGPNVMVKEGCLSYPNVFVDLERPWAVKVKYLDEKFVEHIGSFNGLEARVIQHEQDHLLAKCRIMEEYEKTKTNQEISTQENKTPEHAVK